MFNQIMSQVSKELTAGNLEHARELLDELWKIAVEPIERKTAHDLGNKIQGAIFEQYLNQN